MLLDVVAHPLCVRVSILPPSPKISKLPRPIRIQEIFRIDQSEYKKSFAVCSTNNIPDAKVLNANYINVRDIMVFEKVIMPVDALDLIKANLGGVGE